MADEILHSSLEADLREADRIAGAVRMSLADTFSIRGVPGAIDYLGRLNGFGSDTVRTGFASHNALVGVSEVNEPANTALTDTSATIALARGAITHELSDLAAMTSRGSGDVGFDFLGRKLAGDSARYFMDLVAAAGAAFSSTVGTTTVNMSVDDFFSAKATLINASNMGRAFCVLYPQQWNDLVESLRAEGGAIQYRQDVSAALASTTGQGYAGTYLGVDIYLNDRVDTANTGADSAGFMWHEGALGMVDADPAGVIARAGGQVTSLGDGLAIELQRLDRGASTIVVAHSWCGVGILEDARGVAIITDR